MLRGMGTKMKPPGKLKRSHASDPSDMAPGGLRKVAAKLTGRRLELLQKALKKNVESDVFSQLASKTTPAHRKGIVPYVLSLTKKGVSAKEWDQHLSGKLKKRSSIDVDDLESGDPQQLMPRLRQIHKLGYATQVGIEDTDALNATPAHGTGERQWHRTSSKRKTNPGPGYRAEESGKGGDWAQVEQAPGYLADIPAEDSEGEEKTTSFEWAATGPNAGETARDAPVIWRLPGKLKRSYAFSDPSDLEQGAIRKEAADTYYHGTRPSLIPKIMKEGLDP